MTDKDTIPVATPLEGRMFLYEKPELLSKEVHGNLGLQRVARPYDFVSRIRAVPLTALEVVSAQRHYPVVFSDLNNPVPTAILGVFEDLNLFVDQDGQWHPDTYVPAYIRCHPFAFAAGENDQYAVVVDRAAACVSDHPEHPFFGEDGLSDMAQSQVDFCGKYEAERRRTREFSARIKELGLLVAHQANQKTEAEEKARPIAQYLAVDRNKLSDLDPKTLHELHTSGLLAVLFAHVFSLENWGKLVQRWEVRTGRKVPG